MSETPLLGLPIMEASQAQKHVTHNEALLLLDAAIHLSVVSRILALPPPAPTEGVRYLVAASPSGVWSGQAGKLAVYQASGWLFSSPRKGWRVWVEDEEKFLVFDGTLWRDLQSGGSISSVPLLGINATADTTNRLSVASPGVLLNHAGSDHRLKINKNAAVNTGSLLFQTNFSGRAEMGLAGDDDFHFKVSADGSAWNEAIVIDRSTGTVSLPNTGFSGSYPTRSNLVAAVAGGLARSNGTITHADGLAYCWRAGALELPGLPGLVPAAARTLRHFGALGNSTSNDAVAVIAALNSGLAIDGEGRAYGVSGSVESTVSQVMLANAKFVQLAPTTANCRTLFLNGVVNWALENITVDMGGATGTGDSQDYAGIRVNGGSGLLRDIVVENGGPNTGLGVLNCDTVRLERCTVRNMNWIKTGVIDDILQGIWIASSSNVTCIDCRTYDFSGINNGVPTQLYTRGFAIAGTTNLQLIGCRAELCNQGFDISGSSGNRHFSVSGCHALDCGTWGFKFANTAADGTVSNCIAKDCGSAGFVASGYGEVLTAPNTQRILFSNCTVYRAGSNGLWTSTVSGFRLIGQPFDASYPREIVFDNCLAVDDQPAPTMKYGFYSDVTQSAAARSGNAAWNCRSIGHVTADFTGFPNVLERQDPLNGVVNPGFGLGDTGWLRETGWTIENDPANADVDADSWIAKNTDVSGTTRDMRSLSVIAVVPGDSVFASARLKTSASPAISNFRCRIIWLNAAGGVVGGPGAPVNVNSQQLTYVTNELSAVAPANAVAAQLSVIVAKTAGTVWVDRCFMCRERDAQTLLLDGTVTSALMGGDISAAGKNLLTAATAAAQRLLINNGSWTAQSLNLGNGSGVTDIEAVVVDAACTLSSVIELRFAPTLDTDENEPEFLNVWTMNAKPASGSFALSVSFAERHSGPLKLQYRIN